MIALESSLFIILKIGPRFYFCSEIKGLLQVPEIGRELNPVAVCDYVNLQYVPAPLTLLKGIFKLEPGHCLTWKAGKVGIEQLWDAVPQSPVHASFSDSADRLYSALNNSVRRQLVSDVPVGLFLSGGLDSSAILACAADVHRGKLKAYNIAYPKAHARLEQSGDDARYARIVADEFGAELHQIVVEPDVVDLLPKVAYYLDDPVGDPHTVSTYLICKAARPDVTVLLSGQGADEMLGGYRVHMIHRFAKLLSALPTALRRGILMRWLRTLEKNCQKLPLLPPGLMLGVCRVSEKYLNAAGMEPAEQFAQARSFHAPEGVANLLAPEMFSAAAARHWQEKMAEIFSKVAGKNPFEPGLVCRSEDVLTRPQSECSG